MDTCEIENCSGDPHAPGTAKGLCRKHYRRLQRYGDPQEPVRRVLKHEGPCSVDGCDQEAHSKGMCKKHYTQWYREQAPGCSQPGCSGVATRGDRCFRHRARTHRNPDKYDGNCAVCGSPDLNGKLRTNLKSVWFHFCSAPCRLKWRSENAVKGKAGVKNSWLAGVDREVYGRVCVVCGEDRVVDICHKIPRVEGGTLDPSNIYILCPTHHRVLDHCPEKFSAEEKTRLRTVAESWDQK